MTVDPVLAIASGPELRGLFERPQQSAEQRPEPQRDARLGYRSRGVQPVANIAPRVFAVTLERDGQ